MANYNIQIAQRNADNTAWNNYYPITKAENVIINNGETIATQMEGYYLPKENIRIPIELGFSIPISIRKNGIGIYETNIEPEDFFPSTGGKTYYVDIVNGSSTNNGLTLQTAFKNIFTALEKTDVETIMVAEGWYNKDQHPAPTKNVKIKAIPGHNVIFGADSAVTWTQYIGATYQCIRSLTAGVWDILNKDENGNLIPMTKKATIDDVIATPNSWCFDSNTNTVYVHTFDSRVPDSNIKVSVDAPVFSINNGITVYLEGIKCYFGQGVAANTLDGTATPTFLAKNCKFNYTDNLNGLNVYGAKLIILKDCESSNNYKDGFNYHDKLSATGEFIEINCVGRNNGKDGAGINNGSTSHENYKGIRIGGQYDNNDGPNVADVNNAMTLNVGCSAYDSKTTIGDQADFRVDNKMWLDNCYSKGSQYSVLGNTTATIKIRNSVLLGTIFGTVGTY